MVQPCCFASGHPVFLISLIEKIVFSLLSVPGCFVESLDTICESLLLSSKSYFVGLNAYLHAGTTLF